MPNSPVAATPTIRRRLTASLYETFLLAAVLLFATALFMLVTLNSQAPLFAYARTLWLFAVTGAYFIFCWTDSGHTLAMKTWRVKLVGRGGAPVSLKTATLRYLLAWGWVAPALLVSYLFGLTANKAAFGIALTLGVAAWALSALFDKDRQFLHDRLAGTRLVLLPKPGRSAPAAQGAST